MFNLEDCSPTTKKILEASSPSTRKNFTLNPNLLVNESNERKRYNSSMNYD